VFLFKSSLKVGSYFIEVQSSNENREDDDVLLMGIDDLEDSFYPEQAAKDSSGYFEITNTTTATVVAYHIYTNFDNFRHRRYKFTPRNGFLLPGKTLRIAVECHDYSFDAPEMIRDLVFIKAIPVDEFQINETNLHDLKDFRKIFNQYNIDLMFTVSMLSAKFVQFEIKRSPLKEITNKTGSFKGKRNQTIGEFDQSGSIDDMDCAETSHRGRKDDEDCMK
jgi:hypothetical protein